MSPLEMKGEWNCEIVKLCKCENVEDCAAFAVRGCVRHGVSMAIRFLAVDWAVHDVV
jgi:hypothetical protein